MIIYALNRNFERLCSFDTNETDLTKFSLLTDEQTYTISEGVLLSTFTASFLKKHPMSENLILGNYLAFQDEWGKTWCFTINEITNETSELREIYCEDLGLDLLNSISTSFEANEKQTIEYYLLRELADTGWELGVNEIPDRTRKITFDDSSTTLKRLQNIATNFGCEIYFDVEFRGNNLIRQQVNIVKQIGKEKPSVKLTENKEIIDIKKSINIKDLKTAIYAKGANNSDISSLSYNDGKYVSTYGSNLVFDREATELWNRFPSKKRLDRGFLEMSYTSESSDPAQIISDAINELEKYTQPIATYEANFLFEVGKNISVGDKVQLVDLTFNPKLLLEVRVNSITVSRINSSQNSITISNAREVEDGISNVIKDFNKVNNRVDKIEEESVEVMIFEETKGTKMILTAKIFRGNKEITNQFTKEEFIWIKTDITGIHDEFWEKTHKGVGNIIEVDLNSVDRTAIFNCTVLYHQFVLVSQKWFQDGLKNIVTKITYEKNEDDIAIIFATDLHQAMSTAIRANDEPLRYSKLHIKNIAELTKMTDIDCIILGGDVADGSSTKSLQLQSFDDIIKNLEQSDCPYIIAKGNHDDNSWYAHTHGGPYYNFDNIIKDDEMYSKIAIPSKRFSEIDVQNCYYSIDIGNTRHIVLNCIDIPYILNENGNPKYEGQYTVGYREDQLKWFIEKLETSENKDIFLYQHVQFGDTYKKENEMSRYNEDEIMKIIDDFNNKKIHKSSRTDNPDFNYNVEGDFTRTTGKVVYGMYGHYHNDAITELNGVQYITTGSSVPVERKWRGSGLLADRTLHTLQEDLFDVIIIKPTERKVKMLRFGAGYDREIEY